MRLRVYSEYQAAPNHYLAQRPSHWRWVRYKDVLREHDERSSGGQEELLSVSAYTGVSPRSDIIDASEPISRAESLEGYKLCAPGDLVVNIMLAWNRGLGVSRHSGIVSPSYAVFRPVSGTIVPGYLHYLARSDESIAYYKAYSAGVIDSRLRLYPDVFGQLALALPSCGEQEAIARFLDVETGKIDALIAEQERLIALLQEQRQAVISHAVTKSLDQRAELRDSGAEWIGEVPKHWSAIKLKFVAVVGNGSTPSRENPAYWAGGTYPWLSSTVANRDVVDESEEFVTSTAMAECHLPRIMPPAVLVGITGQGRTRGMATTLQIEATINQHLAYIKPRDARLSVDYLRKVLDAAYVTLRTESESVGSTKGAITCEQIENLVIPLPPEHEQRAVVSALAERAAHSDVLTTEAEHAISLLRERRTALITAAVTGQIDVRGLAESAA